jgi:hypothetical protein
MWSTRTFVSHGHGTLFTPSSSGILSSVAVESVITAYICLLRCALTHSAEEGFAYTPIHSGCEEQQMCTLKQLIHYPCWVGI